MAGFLQTASASRAPADRRNLPAGGRVARTRGFFSMTGCRNEGRRDMSQQEGQAAPVRRSGWLTFSAVVLIIAGIMRVLDAVWAFGYHGAIPQ